MNKKIISTTITLVLIFSILSAMVPTALSDQDSYTTEFDPIEVTKEVYNGEEWVDETEVEKGDIVEFKITITYHNVSESSNNFAYNLAVQDILPPGLEYEAGSAYPFNPIVSGKKLDWDLLDVGCARLYDGESYIIRFNTLTIAYGDNVNEVIVKADEYNSGLIYLEEASAIVKVSEPDGSSDDSGGSDSDSGDINKDTEKGVTPNYPPVADASAEPYIGFIQEPITLNGTKSYDPDGKIDEWNWDYGDGTTGKQELSTHSYSTPGTYSVILTVKDSRGATDSDETLVIISQPNRPPTIPIVDGPPQSTLTTTPSFTALSTDPDNDTIAYTFTWGDNTSTTTDFLANNSPVTLNHTWTSAGEYLIMVQAYDNEMYSDPTGMTIVVQDIEQQAIASVDTGGPSIVLIVAIVIIIGLISFLVLIQRKKLGKSKNP